MREISLENENTDKNQDNNKNKICSKENCTVDEASGVKIFWVQCGMCLKRFHTICVELTNISGKYRRL